jgi:hypothetical protein
MNVSVAVRDLTLTIELGAGTQTFKWLAFTAAAQYAAAHPHIHSSETLTPVHLTDAFGNALYPQEIIAERVESGDLLRLELIGPRIGLGSADFKREKSLWELYAYSDPATSLVPLVFLFDASELALSTPPAVFGNFNSWGTPITMQWWKGNTYKHQMDFPAGAEIVFKFVVGGSAILTPQQYPVVHDSQGNKLHHLRLAPIPPQLNLDASSVVPPAVPGEDPQVVRQAREQAAEEKKNQKIMTLQEIITMNARAQAAYTRTESLARNGKELPVLSSRLVGAYPSGRGISKVDIRAMDRLAKKDWSELVKGIKDVFPSHTPATITASSGLLSPTGLPAPAAKPQPVRMYGVKLAELKQTLFHYHTELTNLFHYYALGTPGCSPNGPHWNVLMWLQFLQIIRVPEHPAQQTPGAATTGGRATVTRLDKIFHLVLSKRGSPSSNSTGAPRGGVGGVRSFGDVPLSHKEIKSTNNSLGKVLLHAEDPFSPVNHLTRTDFIEALVRVAMLKYRNPVKLEDYLVRQQAEEEKKEDGAGGPKIKPDGTVVIPSIVGSKPPVTTPPPPAPTQSNEPNPALSLELLIRMHIQPHAMQQATSEGALYQPIGGSAGVAGGNTNELRHRMLGDANVYATLEKYSPELQRLFRHYTGGAPASGLGLGVMNHLTGQPVTIGGAGGSGASGPNATPQMASVGIIGGTGGAQAGLLPPTLLGQSMSSGGLLSTLLPRGGTGHLANGRTSTTRSSGGAGLLTGSPTIHRTEIEAMLAEYELLDPSATSKARAMAKLGLGPREGDDSSSGGGGSGGDPGSLDSGALEFLYPEWLELLVRVADTGTQWSNLYAEQQRLISAAIASGALNPLDKPPASLMIAAAGGGASGGAAGGVGVAPVVGTSVPGLLDDEEEEALALRRSDDTELCERFLRLIHWLFPSESEQRERRAKLAEQQNANAAPVAAPAKLAAAAAPVEEKKDDAAGGKGTAKGKAKAVGAKPTPAKKAAAKK